MASLSVPPTTFFCTPAVTVLAPPPPLANHLLLYLLLLATWQNQCALLCHFAFHLLHHTQASKQSERANRTRPSNLGQPGQESIGICSMYIYSIYSIYIAHASTLYLVLYGKCFLPISGLTCSVTIETLTSSISATPSSL